MPAAADENEWVTVEFADATDLDGMIFGSEPAALDFVEKVRQLADPQYVPTALVRHKRTVTEELTRIPLEGQAPDADSVLAAVKVRFLEIGGKVPDGVNGLEWAVRTALEESSR